MPRSTGLMGRLPLVAGIALAAATGAVLARTHHLMGQGFENALNTSRGELSFNPAAHPAVARAGDEGYWLTRAEVQSPAPFAKPMAIGDRISIAGVDGRERKLEVIDVKAVGAAGKPDTVSLLLVTCRVTEEGGQESAPVRFIVEGQMPKPPVTAGLKAL